jgi:hypothetical protein
VISDERLVAQIANRRLAFPGREFLGLGGASKVKAAQL